jgi:hypothetical protein
MERPMERPKERPHLCGRFTRILRVLFLKVPANGPKEILT